MSNKSLAVLINCIVASYTGFTTVLALTKFWQPEINLESIFIVFMTGGTSAVSVIFAIEKSNSLRQK
jgi:hypothetical protein